MFPSHPDDLQAGTLFYDLYLTILLDLRSGNPLYDPEGARLALESMVEHYDERLREGYDAEVDLVRAKLLELKLTIQESYGNA